MIKFDNFKIFKNYFKSFLEHMIFVKTCGPNSTIATEDGACCTKCGWLTKDIKAYAIVLKNDPDKLLTINFYDHSGQEIKETSLSVFATKEKALNSTWAKNNKYTCIEILLTQDGFFNTDNNVNI